MGEERKASSAPPEAKTKTTQTDRPTERKAGILLLLLLLPLD